MRKLAETKQDDVIEELKSEYRHDSSRYARKHHSRLFASDRELAGRSKLLDQQPLSESTLDPKVALAPKQPRLNTEDETDRSGLRTK